MSVEGTSACVAGIIPARWGSSRFPGKPLHPLVGKPLLQHVFERVQGCQKLDLILIATDDERIAEAARGFGAEVAMTSPEHPSGTDRIAEAVSHHRQVTHVINVQGDEPLIAPSLVDALAEAMLEDAELPMITAANPITEPDQMEDPNVVKVVLDVTGHSLYFSRSPLPYCRSHPEGLQPLRHMGIYGYRRDFLEEFVQWPPSTLEQAENLEQLRALENGARIRVLITEENSLGLDTPEQIPQIEELLAAPPTLSL